MKILGSDFDGTLTCGGIGEEKISAIKKWQAAGNKFGLVSGRNVEFMQTLKREHPQLQLDFFVACNGGYIIDGQGNILYTAPCQKVGLKDIMRDLFSWGGTFIHVVADRYVCAVEDIRNRPSFIPEDKCCLFEELPDFPRFYEVSVEFSSPQEAAPVVAKIAERYGDRMTPLQNGRCVDVVAVGVNKAQGLYRVMEFFGCGYDDVIAVGDNINDEAMLQEFRSYAMESGVEEMKRLANGVVRDVTDIFEKEM